MRKKIIKKKSFLEWKKEKAQQTQQTQAQIVKEIKVSSPDKFHVRHKSLPQNTLKGYRLKWKEFDELKKRSHMGS